MSIDTRSSLQGRRVFVCGHRGMVGQALSRRLERENCILLAVGREELDLRDQGAVFAWFAKEKPEFVLLAAGTVGGIMANSTLPATFIYDNIMIAANVIEASRRQGVEKLLSLGSSCIYPKFAPQPITENALLTGSLEPTNEWYAIAKISAIKMCQAYRKQYGCNYITAMPTNLYGSHDNWELQSSHVIPALMVKAHQAKLDRKPELVVWGTGKPRREFLYVDDLADACLFLMNHYNGDEHINIGTGTDIAIGEVARLIAEIVGYEGRLRFDIDKPDGTPRKLLDVTALSALGWSATTELHDGLADTYRWYVKNVVQFKDALAI